MNYKEVNIKITKKLIEENIKNGINQGRFNRHESIAILVDKYADKNGKVLEIGVREGFLFDHLKKKGFSDLYGIDISSEGIEILHKRGYKGHVADAQEDLKTDEKFNTIIMSHCLEHMPYPEKAICNVYNHLEKNGILYIEVPKQPQEPVPTKFAHYYIFTCLNDLKELFSEKWRLLYENEKINKNKERGNIKCIYQKI